MLRTKVKSQDNLPEAKRKKEYFEIIIKFIFYSINIKLKVY